MSDKPSKAAAAALRQFEDWAKSENLIGESYGIRSESSLLPLVRKAWDAGRKQVAAVAVPTDAHIIAAFRAYNGRQNEPLIDGAEAARWKRALVAAFAAAFPPQFQQRVQPWLLECFGAEIAADRAERNHRFLEESLELVQALGCTATEAHQLVDYVFGRPVGDPPQEVGGVMVTLAALCLANRLDMHDAGEVELERICAPEMVARIRAKQAAKPKHSPLPAAPQPPVAATWPIAPEVAAELERSDRTPEAPRILDKGAEASNALKALSREYAERKGDVALLESAKEPVATLHDDGYWTPLKTEAGRQLNERLMRAGARVEVYSHPVPHPAQVDRGDATNLARNMLTVHDCKGITSKGVRVLSEAVMAMDTALKALPAAAVPSDAAIAMWSDHRFSNGQPVPASYRVSLVRDALEKWGTPPAAPQPLLPESGTPSEREKHINELLSILETGPAESSSYYDGFTEKYVCCECFAKHEDSLEIQHEESCSHHVAVANERRKAELVKLIRAAD